MTASLDGVVIKTKSKNKVIAVFLVMLQFGLSIFLYISLAAHIIWPEKGSAVAGVSQMIAYEGYLTDTNGDPLGGAGTPYCFRFSIYDNPTVGAGSKLWPAGTPATTKATTTDGVYSALIGQADALTYNFYDNDTVYLNVEVNTTTDTCAGSWENLSPRQPIAASGYSLASESVYGDIFRTDISNNRAQVGTGAGGASPKLLGLDVKNTTDYIGSSCTTNGTVWYNSAISKALVCENSTIQAISNAGTSTIAALTTNSGGTYATTGTIVFSNSNGVTFGMNGNTITASVDAGGGASPARIMYDNLNGREFITNVTNMTAISQRPIFVPFRLDGPITFNNIALEVSRATSGSNLFTAHAAIYTFVNNTQISRLASLSNSFSNTATASISGVRQFRLTGLETAGSTLSAGNYVMMLYFSAAATASMNYSLRGGQTVGPPVGNIFPGANSQITATSQLSSVYLQQFQGRYSATTASPPSSVNLTQVQGHTSGYPVYFRLFST